MSAAHLLPLSAEDDLEVFAIDDAYLASLSPAEREAIEGADARVAGGTAQLTPHAEIVRLLEEKRRQHHEPRGG